MDKSGAKSWTDEDGILVLDSIPQSPLRRALQVTVHSTAYGKTLAVYDPAGGRKYVVDAELVSYWLEHGTED